jgi:hypothetical protein
MADAIERIAGDAEAGMFVANHILAMHQQSKLLGATSPGEHLARAQAECDRQAAYLAALEDAAGHWELGPGPDPECDHGCWGGHPDSHAMQAWIPGPADGTWMN